MSYPKVTINKEQRAVHRVVVENEIGRPLTDKELVHHKNGDITDNNISNLQIVSRSEHKKIHSEIGSSTRFKKVYDIDPLLVLELYKCKTMGEIAKHIGCSLGTVQRVINDNELRDKIVCKVCGDRARYRRSQLCAKHYLKEYYASHK